MFDFMTNEPRAQYPSMELPTSDTRSSEMTCLIGM